MLTKDTHLQLIKMNNESTADAGAGVVMKRPAEDELHPPTEAKKFAPTITGTGANTPDVPSATPGPSEPPTTSTITVSTNADGTTVTTTTITTTMDNSKKGREIRLEQNRKAARESRKRKKVMVEELQRSVVFFSRANNTLKQQNDELTRLLLQAQEQTKNLATSTSTGNTEVKAESANTPTESAAVAASVAAVASTTAVDQDSLHEQQKNAEIVATQALYESQGFPAAAARAAAQAMNSTGAATLGFDNFTAASRNIGLMVPPPPMQPGATMQAMANFQQAAAAAMQAALQGMTGINGMSLLQSVLQPPPGNMTPHSFTDTMTAIAMQQAAAQHMGQQQQMLQLSTAIAANNAAAAVQQQQAQNAAVASKAAEVVSAVNQPATTTSAEPKVETKSEGVTTSDL